MTKSNDRFGSWLCKNACLKDIRWDFRLNLVVHPAPDGLIGDHDPAFCQQIFDVAEAQREPNIEPDRVLDDFGRKAIATIADLSSSMVRL
jgi:hypothetical protein